MAVNAGTIYSDVRIQLDSLRRDIRRVNSRFDQFAKQNQQQSNRVQKSWRNSFNNISLAGVAAFAGIAAGVKSAITTFAGFEQSLANVESVAGATQQEMQLLEQAAIEAGERTRFSASEAADAMYSLSSAGFDAQQSMDALDGVLTLATSTQSDLAQTSEAVASTISQYGLRADEATRVSNVFAASIQNSQATLQRLQGAMRQAGPVAAGLGVSLEETSASLQALFNSGFRAEQAGTALRNTLSRLANESGPTVEALRQFGITFEEINPAEVGLTAAIERLGEAGLSTGELIAAFGQEVGPQLAALVQTGADSLRDMESAVTGTNAATEAAETQLDTLQGSFDQFRSVLQSTVIQLINEVAPAFRALVDFGRSALQVFNSIPAPVRAFIGVATAAIPVVGALAAAVSALGAALTGGLSLVIPGVIAGVAGLSAAIGVAASNSESASEQTRKLASDLQREREETNKLLSELEDTNRESERRREIIDELNSRYPDLNENINIETASTRELRDEVNKLNQERRRDVEAQVLSRISRLQEGLRSAREDVENYRIGLQNAEEQFGRNSDTYKEQARLLNQAESAFENLNSRVQEQRSVLADLRNSQILATASTEENTDSVKENTDSQTDNEEAVESNVRTWRDWNAEILGVNQELSGVEAAGEFLRRIRRDTDAAREAADLLGQSFDEAAAIREDMQEIRDVLQELFGIDPSQIDESFRAQDDTVQALVNAYRAYERQVSRARESRQELSETENSAVEEATNIADKYGQKLEELNQTNAEGIEAERQRALESVRGLNASKRETEEATQAINEYFDALQDREAFDRFQENATTALDQVSSLFSTLGGLYSSIADRRIAELDRQLQAELEAAGVAKQTELERLREELAEAKRKGDQETQAEIEEEIKRAEITREFEKRKAEVRYKAELAEWRMNLLGAIADTASAIVQALPNIPLSITAGVIGAAQTAIVANNRPEPPQFQTGGIVVGSGTQDGVTARVAEGGSNELLLNDSSEGQQFLRRFATEIANQMGGQGGTMSAVLEVDGQRLSETVVRRVNNGQVRLKL